MSASAMVDPKEREVLDHAFPEDPVDFLHQHGYSGRKAFYSPDEAMKLGRRVWSLHDALQATMPDDTLAILRSMPWPVSAIPDDLVVDLRLVALVDLARELNRGTATMSRCPSTGRVSLSGSR